MKKHIRRWIFPLIFEFLLILPYLDIPAVQDLWGDLDKSHPYLIYHVFYGVQFATVLTVVLLRKATYFHFLGSQAIALLFLFLLTLIEKLPLIELTVFRHQQLLGHFGEVILIFLNFAFQLAGGFIAVTAQNISDSIKNKNTEPCSPAELPQEDNTEST